MAEAALRARARWCLRRPLVPVTGAAACLAVALFVFTLLGKEFLPELDEGDLWVRTQFPVGDLHRGRPALCPGDP